MHGGNEATQLSKSVLFITYDRVRLKLMEVLSVNFPKRSTEGSNLHLSRLVGEVLMK